MRQLHEAFPRRRCLHVLPKGFVRVRHHGWMSGAARKVRLRVRALVCGQLDEPAPAVILPPVPRCARRGAEMTLIATIEPRGPPPRR
ncbi:MAG: transposase [Akkermansiaceae bacterium]|nr:transposase [Akkermansiaceae bacterium]